MFLISILKKAFGFGVMPKLASLVNLLLLPLITPFLTPFDYGIWGVITSYSGLFITIAPLGLNLFLTNSYYEYSNHWRVLWGRVICYFYLSGILLSIVYICVIMGMLSEVGIQKRFLIAMISCVPLLLFGNTVIAQHLYPLKGTPKPLVYRTLLGSICGMTVSFVSIYFFKAGYWGFLFGVAVTAIVSFTLFCPLLFKKEGIKPIIDRKWKKLVDMLKLSWPLIPHALGFVLLSSSSRIIMNLYQVSLEDIGLFSNGYMMGDYITIITTSLVVALVPQLQKTYRDKRFVDYRSLYYFCQFTTLTAVFTVAIWMPDIYRVVIRNESFQSCSAIASIICFANVLLPFYNFTSNVAFIKKDSKQLLWLIFMPGAVNIFLSIILIPILGYVSVVYSTLVSYWTIAIIPFFVPYFHKNTKVWMGKLNRIIVILLIVLLAVVVAQYLSQTLWWIKIMVMIPIVLVYFFMLNKFQIKKIFQ